VNKLVDENEDEKANEFDRVSFGQYGRFQRDRNHGDGRSW